MPSYKLIYFKGRGRGETIRMLFTLAGQEFEDVRLEREAWLKIKPGKSNIHVFLVEKKEPFY